MNPINTITRMAHHCGARSGCAVLCALAFLAPGIAAAADWNIDPVRVELSPQQATAAIIVRNSSDQPSSIQIQAVAWSQLDGKDVYTPTRELLVSPPIVTIAPQSDQVIRVALRRPADAGKELAYRIHLQELPQVAALDFTGVSVAMRVGLPVFVQPLAGPAQASMRWSVARMPDHRFKVVVRNQGNAHVQISDFSLSLPGSSQAIAGETGSSYVMPGQAHEWMLPAAALGPVAGARLRLLAYTDAGDVDSELVLDRP